MLEKFENISEDEILSILRKKYLSLERKSTILFYLLGSMYQHGLFDCWFDDVDSTFVELIQIKELEDIKLIVSLDLLINKDDITETHNKAIYVSCLDSLNNKTKLIILRDKNKDFSYFKVLSTIRQLQKNLSDFE